ncbi:hypothetical protein CCMA1212_007611 [Trichoderma ghanense]|uniref:Uncharacterized protein n=1 Tax=Trichoderma ghanense TaxID=65468 RepID=A0ABY2GWN9_9HYPO
MQQIRRRQPGQASADDGDPRLALATRRFALSRRHLLTLFVRKAVQLVQQRRSTDSLLSSSSLYA